MPLFSSRKGKPEPFGATITDHGVNFAIYVEKSKTVSLIINGKQEFKLDPLKNTTGSIWHVFIEGLKPPFSYLYKVGKNLLHDPYAKAVDTGHEWASGIEKLKHEKSSYLPAGVVSDSSFDWENDAPPLIPLEDLIIYEMHVRGLTRHASSRVKHPGTFLGMIEKIPYLLDLGINAVELLPIQEFNELEYLGVNPATRKRLCNYWGYSTVNFFAPMNRYSTSNELGASLKEFKELVKALHKAGIEVILDVVFNHTAEGNEAGPILSYKGLANDDYYMIEGMKRYANYSGCGNTFNCNHPVTAELIMSALKYWVTEMHVDGFRFDLASIFYRGLQGNPLAVSPIVEAISRSPLLSHIKLISEPWDAVGLYQVGSFYQTSRWSEWNGRYRDTIRRFIKGSSGQKGRFATRICGSQDLYHNKSPLCSINFLTSHDGFSLYDLVSYNGKHNAENGEQNRDGNSQNDSWNCGHEGLTSDLKIVHIRERQMRNFHLALMVSTGIPMLTMGDEYGHTKYGNNNTWCQDNELNWFLWDETNKHPGFYRFCRELIYFRKRKRLLRRDVFLSQGDIIWHGITPHHPRWDIENHLVAFERVDKEEGNNLFIAFNAFHEPIAIELPNPLCGKRWHRIVDTSKEAPGDFTHENDAEAIKEKQMEMAPYSSIMLLAK